MFGTALFERSLPREVLYRSIVLHLRGMIVENENCVLDINEIEQGSLQDDSLFSLDSTDSSHQHARSIPSTIPLGHLG